MWLGMAPSRGRTPRGAVALGSAGIWWGYDASGVLGTCLVGALPPWLFACRFSPGTLQQERGSAGRACGAAGLAAPRAAPGPPHPLSPLADPAARSLSEPQNCLNWGCLELWSCREGGGWCGGVETEGLHLNPNGPSSKRADSPSSTLLPHAPRPIPHLFFPEHPFCMALLTLFLLQRQEPGPVVHGESLGPWGGVTRVARSRAAVPVL